MNVSSLTFDILPSNASNPLGAEVWINNQKIVDMDQITSIQHIKCNFDDNEQSHLLKIVVKNKTSGHTQISESGDIVSDSLLDINNFKIDDIDLNNFVQQRAVYIHNFNGAAPLSKHEFFGIVGCNGSIEFEFASPVYLWLLENL